MKRSPLLPGVSRGTLPPLPPPPPPGTNPADSGAAAPANRDAARAPRARAPAPAAPAPEAPPAGDPVSRRLTGPRQPRRALPPPPRRRLRASHERQRPRQLRGRGPRSGTTPLVCLRQAPRRAGQSRGRRGRGVHLPRHRLARWRWPKCAATCAARSARAGTRGAFDELLRQAYEAGRDAMQAVGGSRTPPIWRTWRRNCPSRPICSRATTMRRSSA